ncbi:C-C motif chemokine 19-like [Carcharodon carcharias]|uniref:C-C motif chemokine 19-like n=1 Tax=Carcharodon carcharias TaxID=13397 RepID=UPI001B7DB75B|nr:C-C motif chemokine 19-like [Carcharodon carcharias]
MSLHIKVAFLLLAVACHSCKGSGGDDGAVDCCLNVSHNVIPKRIVVGCKVQDASLGCRIPAVVFITVRNKKLCAPQGPRWVKKLLKRCQRLQELHGQ